MGLFWRASFWDQTNPKRQPNETGMGQARMPQDALSGRTPSRRKATRSFNLKARGTFKLTRARRVKVANVAPCAGPRRAPQGKGPESR